MKILMTGFEPFNNEKINPSFEAVKRIDNIINDIEITKLEIPVSYQKAFSYVRNELENHHYDAVIIVGQAGGRSGISLEKVAINYIYSSILDNDGVSLNHEMILKDSDVAYFSTLPILKMEEALKENNIKASISYTCGTYVCNYLMYSVLNYFKDTNVKSGFIHVPFIKEQVVDKENMPYMELDDIVKALEICVKNLFE